jgi:hypothetical protein
MALVADLQSWRTPPRKQVPARLAWTDALLRHGDYLESMSPDTASLPRERDAVVRDLRGPPGPMLVDAHTCLPQLPPWPGREGRYPKWTVRVTREPVAPPPSPPSQNLPGLKELFANDSHVSYRC